MAFPNAQLYLDKFVAYNEVRYKDNPAFIAALSGLTLDQVAFSNIRKQVDPNGQINYLVDMVSANLFTAVDQHYIPADFIDNGPASLVVPFPLTVADIKAKAVQGIYTLLNSDSTTGGAVLVPFGSNMSDTVVQTIQANCMFAVLATEITVDSAAATATIDSQTIVGTLTVIGMDGTAVYDGTYNFDGTLTF